MRNMVKEIHSGTQPATEHLESPELVELAKSLFKESRVKGVLTILNQVGDKEVETYLRKALANHGIEPIGVIREEPSFVASWLKGEPLPIGEAEKEAEAMIEALEAWEEGSV